jgi:hypothetical protein
MTAVGRGLQYIRRVIGSHNVSAPLKKWEELRNAPYRNNLFSAKMVDRTIQFGTDVRATPALMMVNLMKGENCQHRDFSYHNHFKFAKLELNEQLSDKHNEELYTLDTLGNGIPGRWACMVSDFGIDGGIVTKNEQEYEPDGVLTAEYMAETKLSEINGNLNVRRGPYVSDNFKPSKIAEEIFVHNAPKLDLVQNALDRNYSGYWITGDSMCTPAVEYFMHKTKNLASFGDIQEEHFWDRYHPANKCEGGISIPIGYFSEAYLDLNLGLSSKDEEYKDMTVRGWNDYGSHYTFPFEELVVLEEAIKSAGGDTFLKINPGDMEDLVAHRCIKNRVEFWADQYLKVKV